MNTAPISGTRLDGLASPAATCSSGRAAGSAIDGRVDSVAVVSAACSPTRPGPGRRIRPGGVGSAAGGGVVRTRPMAVAITKIRSSSAALPIDANLRYVPGLPAAICCRSVTSDMSVSEKNQKPP